LLTKIKGICSLAYIIFHLIAAGSNEAIGLVRPPVRRLHATCFLVARLCLLLWILALVLDCVFIVKGWPSSQLKIFQAVGIVASGLALCVHSLGNRSKLTGLSIATGILLTALESRRYPFQLPTSATICKVGDCEDDIDALERGGSDISPYEDKQTPEKPKAKMEIQRKPVPRPVAKPQPVPDIWPERPMTPLLPPKVARSRGWGEEWTYGEKALARPDSGISMASRSSSGYMNSESSRREISIGYMSSDQESLRKSAILGRQRAKTVTPTSSISNMSRRSPLSIITYVS